MEMVNQYIQDTWSYYIGDLLINVNVIERVGVVKSVVVVHGVNVKVNVSTLETPALI